MKNFSALQLDVVTATYGVPPAGGEACGAPSPWKSRETFRAEQRPPGTKWPWSRELPRSAEHCSARTQSSAPLAEQCSALLPPLAVGWSLKLVALHDAHILWAMDEVFDAGEPAVVTAARRYHREHHSDRTALADSRSMLNSPSRFGRYAAHATFASLPDR